MKSGIGGEMDKPGCGRRIFMREVCVPRRGTFFREISLYDLSAREERLHEIWENNPRNGNGL